MGALESDLLEGSESPEERVGEADDTGGQLDVGARDEEPVGQQAWGGLPGVLQTGQGGLPPKCIFVCLCLCVFHWDLPGSFCPPGSRCPLRSGASSPGGTDWVGEAGFKWLVMDH